MPGNGFFFSFVSRLNMAHVIRSIAALIALCSVTGCMLLNDTLRLADDMVLAPTRDRAVVVFGIAVEGAWNYPEFGVVIDEYNLEKKAITGNCWRYNRVHASVPKSSATVQLFAFDVAPGYYIFSAFNVVRFRGDNTFFVPEGKVVYLGEFVYTADGTVVLRHRDAKTASVLTKKFPNLKENIVLAESRVGVPTMFLCTP